MFEGVAPSYHCSPHLPHRRNGSMPSNSFIHLGTLLLAATLMACATDVTEPATGPALDIVVEEVMVAIPDVDFDEANVSKVSGVCVMSTPTGNLILKDANPNTPSQPCPPPFAFKGKGEQFPMNKEWAKEDENRNGVVCVKATTAGKYIVKDDNDATPSQPCPPAFIISGNEKQVPAVPGKFLEMADDNRNGAVCLLVTGSGNFVVKDDNTDLPSQPCAPAYSYERLAF
jgi:hypothetical protein